MFLKIIRHSTITILLALSAALIIFLYSRDSLQLFTGYLLFAGAFVGFGMWFTQELSIFIRQVISIAGVLLFYFLFRYLLFIELETDHPSIIKDKSPLQRGLMYLYNLNYRSFIDFWPLFKQSLNLKTIGFLLIGMEGLFYTLFRIGVIDLFEETELEDSSRPSGAIIPNKRRVRGRRFTRRF